ncbi:MAG: cbb3-type cytochrome c oxidase subunit I [Holophagaceae bacterium]|nr:cbb3-type cytochrome c oxidase subunit I [Holophagaceae bacterium]
MQPQFSKAEVATTPEGALVHDDSTAKWFLVSSVAYFFIVGIIAVIIAAKFVWPDLMGTMSWLTYGRLRPLHVNGMLFGWLLAADMGLAYYVIPRLCGVKLWSEKLGLATAILWNVIILGAVVTLLAGKNQGWEYAELPWYLDILVVVAWIMFGLNVLMTVASRKHQAMYVTIWYTMGCILWTAFVYLTGNFATLFATGTNQANLNWMYVHNAVGLIFTPIGLAIAYYFIPRASNTPLHSHKLSMVGFWSLAFVYVWTGAHHMIHGPISQWLQTIAIAFSVMLLIPVWAVVYNLFATMKGQWHQLRESVPLKFLMSGVVFYLLTCFQGPMHSLRTVNAIVSKTDWIPGHAHMAVLGCFSFFAIAGTYFTVPKLWGKPLHSQSLANWSYWMLMIGGLGFFTTLWLGGFWQGWQWNNWSIPFIDTVIALKPIWIVRFVSGILMFIGIVMFAYNILATAMGANEEAAA